MKIAGLISRFENKEVGKEPKSPSGEHSDRPTPRPASPGRLNIRNAIKNLRAPRSPGNLKNFEKIETEEPETAPTTVETRVDNVLKSIVSRRSSIEDMKKSEEGASETEDETNIDAGNRTEFLISEHSNRTLVVDNKKNKSQNPVLPDTPWSSRNLAGSSRPRTNSHEKVRPVDDKAQKRLDDGAEYGTLALRSDDAAISEEPDESLPPEVVAMSAASEKLKLKSKTRSLPSPKKSRSLDDVLKLKESTKKVKNLSADKIDTSQKGDETNGQRARRRLSPGFLRRRGSNEKSEPKQKEIAVVPPEDHNTLRPPTRSLSAGNLRMARSKAKSIRERKARSQSPGDENAGERKIRPGRKKSESNILAAKAERDVAREEGSTDASARDEHNESEERPEPPRSLRRIRGRSPGDDGKSDDADDTKDSDDKDPSKRPALNRLPSRGRSPGTIRKSIDMSGEVSRDVSPGTLKRGRSPGTLRRNIDTAGETCRDVSPDVLGRSESPAALRNRSPGALRSRSPGALRKSVEKSGERFRDVSPDVLGRSKSPAALRSRSPGALRGSIEKSGEACRDASPANLGRGRSPGALRKSTNATSESYRSTSPGALSRSKQTSARGKSPGTLRRMNSSKARSPGRLTSLHKSSAHSNGSCESPRASTSVADRRSPGTLRRSSHSIRARSPGALRNTVSRKKSPVRDIVVPPPLASNEDGTSAEPPQPLVPTKDPNEGEESKEAASASGEQADDELAQKNLSVPRSKSPGALARRPSKNPRAAQTKKAQSLFEKKSPSAMLASPRRKMSRDDTSLRLSAFDEADGFSSQG